MRELNMDTQRQNFWKESINNEVTIRNKWFQQHMRVNFSENKNPVPKPRPAKIINVQPLKKPPAPPAKTVTVTKSEPKSELKLKSEMRVASPETLQVLYTGLSAEGDGRKAYLLQRKMKGPEEKYEYPLTSALEVGWKIRSISSKMESKPAQFGRSRIVQDTFFRTNGVL